jgi:hypothetical protein
VPIGHGAVTSSYKVIFEEVIEAEQSGLQYGMFIDDVYIKDQSCSSTGDCDFENGFCMLLKSIKFTINIFLFNI